MVPLDALYVDANFKEVQLRKVRLGQPVTLKSDKYGGAAIFHGRVAGIGGGTGSAFAVIPAQNATGNWIKVVQRLPVRIRLDGQELRAHPLEVGLSMDAKIDIASQGDDRPQDRDQVTARRQPPGRRAMSGASAPGGGATTTLTGGALILAGFVLAMSNFMAVLDTSIANVSIPNIAGGLAVSPSEGTWVITSYQVAEAITVPLTGWLAQRFGAVKVYVTCITMFGLFSALCGLAPSLSIAGFLPHHAGPRRRADDAHEPDLLLRVFPPSQAPQAIGIWSMTTVVGPIAGPLLGGTLSDSFGWPSVFFVNIPGGDLLRRVRLAPAGQGRRTPFASFPSTEWALASLWCSSAPCRSRSTRGRGAGLAQLPPPSSG